LAKEVKRLTAGRGADVVLDMTGGSFFDHSLAALAPFGRLVVYGTASRERSNLVPQRLMPLNQAVIGYYVSHWFNARPELARKAFDTVAGLALGQRIRVAVTQRLPLDEVRPKCTASWKLAVPRVSSCTNRGSARRASITHEPTFPRSA
jgi:NADPH2:quinone reductase